METESKKENEIGRNEPLASYDALNDFFRLLDRQTEDKLPANLLLAMLGLYDVLQIITCAARDTQSLSLTPKSQVQPLRNALMNMLAGKGNPDMGLQDMAQMLGSNPVPALMEMARSLDKNPSALVSLLSMLTGPGTGGGKPSAPPAAPAGQDFYRRPDDGKRQPGTGR